MNKTDFRFWFVVMIFALSAFVITFAALTSAEMNVSSKTQFCEIHNWSTGDCVYFWSMVETVRIEHNLTIINQTINNSFYFNETINQTIFSNDSNVAVFYDHEYKMKQLELDSKRPYVDTYNRTDLYSKSELDSKLSEINARFASMATNPLVSTADKKSFFSDPIVWIAIAAVAILIYFKFGKKSYSDGGGFANAFSAPTNPFPSPSVHSPPIESIRP